MGGGERGLDEKPRFDKIAWSDFARPTKFAWSKFERTKCGPKGELQDVIRNGARRERRRDAPNNPDPNFKDTGFPLARE